MCYQGKPDYTFKTNTWEKAVPLPHSNKLTCFDPPCWPSTQALRPFWIICHWGKTFPNSLPVPLLEMLLEIVNYISIKLGKEKILETFSLSSVWKLSSTEPENQKTHSRSCLLRNEETCTPLGNHGEPTWPLV